MKPDVYSSIGTLAARYGVEAAAEVAALEAKHVSVIKSLIDREQISCDLEVSKAIDVQLDESHNAKLLAGYDALIAGGSEATKAAAYVSGSEAEMVSPSWLILAFSVSDIFLIIAVWSQRSQRSFYLSDRTSLAV
jgi:hypothetical protein